MYFPRPARNRASAEYWKANYRKLKWKVPAGASKYPVNYVSYTAAREYCVWAGMRLLSEPEWQRAFYGDKKRPYIFGVQWKKASLTMAPLKNAIPRVRPIITMLMPKA